MVAAVEPLPPLPSIASTTSIDCRSVGEPTGGADRDDEPQMQVTAQVGAGGPLRPLGTRSRRAVPPSFASGRGLWRGGFEPPWDWRKEHPHGGATRP